MLDLGPIGVGRDQADGLRRLCGKAARQVITFTGATRGAGRTALVLHAATALAALGRRVLVIDENSGLGNINDQLRLGLRYELAHVFSGDRAFQDVVRAACPGVRVLPAARLAGEAAQVESEHTAALLAPLVAETDVVLIDAAETTAGARWPVHGDRRCVVLVPAGAASVTTAYGFIKHYARSGWHERLEAVIARVATEAQGVAIHANLAQVAQRFLARPLALAGVWVSDPAVAAALHSGRTLNMLDPEHAVARRSARLANHLLGTAVRAAESPPEPWLARLLRTAPPTIAWSAP